MVLAATGLALLLAGVWIGSSLQGRPTDSPPPAASRRVWQPDPLHQRTDVSALITLESREEALARRDALWEFIRGEPGLPVDLRPVQVDPDVEHPRLPPTPHLAGADRMTVVMPLGFTSVVYRFRAAEPNGGLVLYHEGHGNRLLPEAVHFFLEEGYDVLGLLMPQLGPNSQPVVHFPRFGALRLDTHDHMRLLEHEGFHPMRYFVEPVTACLNQALEDRDYRRVGMLGISGGGWSTALYAALDPRVERSFPIAGTLPFFLRSSRTHDRGDWEQTHPGLYAIANRLELYVLGALEQDRLQMQVFNVYDGCCFGGERALLYDDTVRATLERLGGGTFLVHLDDTHHEHKISRAAYARILEVLER